MHPLSTFISASLAIREIESIAWFSEPWFKLKTDNEKIHPKFFDQGMFFSEILQNQVWQVKIWDFGLAQTIWGPVKGQSNTFLMYILWVLKAHKKDAAAYIWQKLGLFSSFNCVQSFYPRESEVNELNFTDFTTYFTLIRKNFLKQTINPGPPK